MCASIFKKHTTQRYIYILLFFCALFVVVFYPSLRSSFLFRQSCALPLVGYNKHATRLNHWETDDILHAPMTILCQQTKHTHTHTQRLRVHRLAMLIVMVFNNVRFFFILTFLFISTYAYFFVFASARFAADCSPMKETHSTKLAARQ